MSARSIIALVVLCSICACNSYPGTEEGARKLVLDLRSGKVSGEKLAPKLADIRAVFEDDVVDAMARHYGDGDSEVKAYDYQTELVLRSATTDDMRAGDRDALGIFPGGYGRVASKLKPGLTIYRWKYVRPGETSGYAYDGLVYVNFHWVWFPKPWRALER